jgi:hypothetical protein
MNFITLLSKQDNTDNKTTQIKCDKNGTPATSLKDKNKEHCNYILKKITQAKRLIPKTSKKNRSHKTLIIKTHNN